MSKEISPDDLVTVGDRTRLSFHQLQDIYNTLTGRTENITQLLIDPYQIKLEDILQLHQRIKQCCNSYGAALETHSVAVYHIDGRKEEFSSIDRFKLYNKSYNSLTENVHVEYNFLVIPSGTDKAKHYKIMFDFPSRLGLRVKQRVSEPMLYHMMSMLSDVPGRYRINFVDYAVARHFQAQLDEWYQSLDRANRIFALEFVQKHSHWLRTMLPLIFVVTGFMSLYAGASDWLQDEVTNPVLFELVSLSGAFIVLVWFVGRLLGRALEWAVDRIQPSSYVHLNRADEKYIRIFKRRNLLNILLSLGGIISTVALNIFSAVLVEWWLNPGIL